MIRTVWDTTEREFQHGQASKTGSATAATLGMLSKPQPEGKGKP
jgi:hypothetical protein